MITCRVCYNTVSPASICRECLSKFPWERSVWERLGKLLKHNDRYHHIRSKLHDAMRRLPYDGRNAVYLFPSILEVPLYVEGFRKKIHRATVKTRIYQFPGSPGGNIYTLLKTPCNIS